jgi:hypothetical protein
MDNYDSYLLEDIDDIDRRDKINLEYELKNKKLSKQEREIKTNELKCLNKKIQSREIAIKLYIILGFSIIAFDIIFIVITIIKG